MKPAKVTEQQPTFGDRRRLAEYLSLLYAKAEGHGEAKMARDICGIDPLKEPARAKRVLRSRLKQAQRLADNPQLLLTEGRWPVQAGSQRNKVR